MNEQFQNIYFFGGDLDSSSRMPTKEEVGSKAFNLIRMSELGLPVPPGFAIGTEFCRRYLNEELEILQQLKQLLGEGIDKLQEKTGLVFGGKRRPLLLSVRSGAAVSMPGMMDTLLNVGLNDIAVSSLIRMTGNPRFAWDSYRRLIQSYAEVVYGSPARPFEETLLKLLRKEEIDDAKDLDSRELSGLCKEYLEIFEKTTHRDFPQDPSRQLIGAVEAVFRSWQSSRAIEYRRMHRIDGLAGTAVTVQMMVFGNMGSTSGSGVGFTRNPVTGEDGLYMDFLFNAQGEDIVSGRSQTNHSEKLAQALPSVLSEIRTIGKKLEFEFQDMQDFEFTFQEGKLYLLQCRTGKRTPWAALKIAVDLVNEGIIDPNAALHRLEVYDLASIKNTKLANNSSPIASGLPANRGVATGEIAFDPQSASERAKSGRSVILVREDMSTSDIAGLATCMGILTKLGGRTSHAAVVARQMDKVCIVGCKQLTIDSRKRNCTIGEKEFNEKDCISLDGNSGNVYSGSLDVIVERPLSLLAEVDGWRGSQQHKGLEPMKA